MGLTVELNYNGTIYHFSKILNGIVDQNSELHFNISSSTGGYPTNHSIKFNSMTYSSIADKPVINTAKDSDTSVTGTGTPGNSVTVYDASGKKLSTATVKEDGTWSLPVEQGTLKAGEKLTATQKAPGSNQRLVLLLKTIKHYRVKRILKTVLRHQQRVKIKYLILY